MLYRLGAIEKLQSSHIYGQIYLKVQSTVDIAADAPSAWREKSINSAAYQTASSYDKSITHKIKINFSHRAFDECG